MTSKIPPDELAASLAIAHLRTYGAFHERTAHSLVDDLGEDEIEAPFARQRGFAPRGAGLPLGAAGRVADKVLVSLTSDCDCDIVVSWDQKTIDVLLFVRGALPRGAVWLGFRHPTSKAAYAWVDVGPPTYTKQSHTWIAKEIGFRPTADPWEISAVLDEA